MTYQNLGYWIGQANDLSTGSHPTGWTNGQRWSETAGEWQTMYSASASDATLWHGRADQAWGPSDVWSSGSSWETLYTTNANVRALDVGRIGTSGFNLSGSETLMLLNTSQSSGSAATADPGNRRIVINRTGQYVLTLTLRCNMNSGGVEATVNAWIRRSGTKTWTTAQGSGVRRDLPSNVSITAIAALTAGDTLDAVGDVTGGTPAAVGTESYLQAVFIPTPANPS